ncbi:hypothetical protein HDU82_005227 [Entophlyctis luteolus]|nr:hypothetical protein HDU82_005227 [Entophlyctis luteolus]
MPHNHSIIIAESHTCYPLLQNLAILTSLLAALFATSAILDVCAYARGAWFDAKDSRDRTRAEHLATLRRCARLGSARAGIGIHDAEFACVSPTRAKSPRDAGDTDRARLLPASPTDDSSPTGASASPLGGSAPEGWSPCKPGPSGSRRQSAVNIAEGNGFNFKGASSLVRTAVANSNGYGKSRVGSISVASVPQPRSGAATPEQQRSRQGSVASLMRRGGKQ